MPLTPWSKWHEGHLRSKPRQVGASGAQCVADAGVPRWVPKSTGDEIPGRRMGWGSDMGTLYIFIHRYIIDISLYIFIHSYIIDISLYIFIHRYIIDISLYIFIHRCIMYIFIYLYISLYIFIYLYISLYIFIYLYISLYIFIYLYISLYIFISSYHWCSNWEKHQWMDHEDVTLPCLIVGSYGARSKCATKCDTSLQLLPQHVSINSVRWYANQVMYLCMSVSVCLPACLPACLPPCLPTCLPVCLSVCLSAYMHVKDCICINNNIYIYRILSVYRVVSVYVYTGGSNIRYNLWFM